MNLPNVNISQSLRNAYALNTDVRGNVVITPEHTEGGDVIYKLSANLKGRAVEVEVLLDGPEGAPVVLNELDAATAQALYQGLRRYAAAAGNPSLNAIQQALQSVE